MTQSLQIQLQIQKKHFCWDYKQATVLKRQQNIFVFDDV